MNGQSIGWDEAVPSDNESAGLGDDRIRSLKTSLRQALDDEHNWSSAGGGNTGYHRMGSARPFYGTQSAVSSAGTDARLMQTSDTSRLFGVGSGGTTFLGGPRVIQAADFPGAVPQRHYWVEEFGTAVLGSLSTVQVTIPNSGYSGVPFIFMTSIYTTGVPLGNAGLLNYYPIDGANFVVKGVDHAGNAIAGQAFVWRSFGTRVF